MLAADKAFCLATHYDSPKEATGTSKQADGCTDCPSAGIELHGNSPLRPTSNPVFTGTGAGKHDFRVVVHQKIGYHLRKRESV